MKDFSPINGLIYPPLYLFQQLQNLSRHWIVEHLIIGDGDYGILLDGPDTQIFCLQLQMGLL